MDTGYDNDNGNDNSITINIRRVKKEEEDETVSVSANRHYGDDNNNRKNNMDGTTNCDDLNRGQQVPAVKKEEEEENDDDDGNNETSAPEEESSDDNYDDWKNGNWCWLLSTNANANANAKTRQSMTAINCATHPVKSENSDSNNNVASATTTTTVAITSTSTTRNRSYDDDDDGDDDDDNIKDDDEDKPPPKKRTRHRRRQPVNDNVKEEEGDDEEDSVYEASNTTTSDNDNDSTNNSTNDSTNNSYNECDDELGYESWTKGNWCLLLPFPPTGVDEIETGPPPTRRSKCNEDDYKVDNDDNDDDVSSAKSKTRRSRTRYTRLQNERWDEMFQLLAAYKLQHGSTLVPTEYEVDPKLGSWVRSQRTCLKQGRLGKSRVKRLDTIGFVWKILDSVPWLEMYQKLVAYKKKHKSTNVSIEYQADPKLGRWVSAQRTNYNREVLSTDRINHLESIGFVWDPHDAQWMEMFSKLVEYKKQNKSTVVPRVYIEDPHLDYGQVYSELSITRASCRKSARNF